MIDKESCDRFYGKELKGDDLADALHKHFELKKFHAWTDVSREGCSVMSWMYGVEIPDDSPMYWAISAISAAGYMAAMSAVATTLGVNVEVLDDVVSSVVREPKYLGFEKLAQEVAECHDEYVKRGLL